MLPIRHMDVWRGVKGEELLRAMYPIACISLLELTMACFGCRNIATPRPACHCQQASACRQAIRAATGEEHDGVWLAAGCVSQAGSKSAGPSRATLSLHMSEGGMEIVGGGGSEVGPP